MENKIDSLVIINGPSLTSQRRLWHLSCFGLFAALSLILSSPASAQTTFITAPNMGVTPANQLKVFANSCGPCALYNSFNYGGEKWRNVLASIPRADSREKIRHIVRTYASRRSTFYKNTKRWNARSGISAKDLNDVANEMTHGRWLPKLTHQTFFQKGGEKNTKLLQRLHKTLKKSLKKELPPIATLQRYVSRKGRSGQTHWILIQSHFVSIVGIPAKLEKDATEFPVTYVDPWGGRFLNGSITAPPDEYSRPGQGGAAFDASSAPSAPRAEFPKTHVGSKKVKRSEKTVLILAGLNAAS